MQNRTPARPHDDGDTIRIEKPDWLPAERWEQIKADAIDHMDRLIAATLEEHGR